ncbi:hydroxyethylthiazole kinase [Mergibacter septicus]|uniref:hydroxyethylthiazole kinase n=1 Tax=Mergibacter septicus TaxID=221402 RepID=UPI001178DB81|nr:hydroxyethylthiazole kinase [Mergibacter septicus]AWX13753.1 hydroxyethylthiazole kinase [Mergibacter septicus]
MLGKYLDNLKNNGALVHSITNYVTVNDVANLLLACGGSPIMADEPEEVIEITAICAGLNINIGTLNSRTIKAMYLAGEKAYELGHKIVLDPVGVGASSLRTETALGLMKKIKFDVIKGNISEIKVLANENGKVLGVDANIKDKITLSNLDHTITFLKRFAKETGYIIVATGEYDLVCDQNKCFVISNGRQEMSKVTGTGCQLSALITAFLVANPNNHLKATAAAVCTMGLAGEIAWKNMKNTEGSSTYRNRIIDAIFNLNGEGLNIGAKYEIR